MEAAFIPPGCDQIDDASSIQRALDIYEAKDPTVRDLKNYMVIISAPIHTHLEEEQRVEFLKHWFLTEVLPKTKESLSNASSFHASEYTWPDR